MRVSGLWIKFALVSIATATISVLIAALLIHKSTTTDFEQYLRIIRGMGSMMGGSQKVMMGPSENAFLGSIGNSLWIAGIIAVTVSIIIAVIFSRQVIAPLNRLSAVASSVKQGDLSRRINSNSNDEVGVLTNTFNSMVESLDKNQKTRRKFMTDLAHEMGTPLSIIQSNLEGIQDGVVEASPENISSIHQEVLLLSRLVRDLRTLSQAESSGLKLSLTPVDVGVLVSSIVNATEPETKRKEVSLKVQIEPGLPLGMMDKDRISQILVNLLSNALHYTSQGDSIGVSVALNKQTDKAGKSLMVSVSDTGQGISKEDLPYIFNHYYRGTQPREKRADGSGIGLAVVKELVEAHRGKVWVDSVQGKGSIFYFTLPIST